MGLEPTSRRATTCFQDRFLIRPDAFRLQAAGAGIEPTSRRSERPVLPLDDPAIVVLASSGGRNRTYGLLVQSQASLPTATTPECGECPAGVEPASPGWKPGTSAARPRAREGGRRGSRTLKAVTLDRFRGGCHRQLACPSVDQGCGGRNRTCVVAVNSRLPVPARAPPHHKSQDGWI